MFVIDLSEVKKDTNEVEEQIEGLIKKCGGELAAIARWDERKLAYEIKGRDTALYTLTYFNGGQDTVKQLNHECRLSSTVLRALFLRIKEIPDINDVIGKKNDRAARDERFEDGGRSSRRGGRDSAPAATEAKPAATDTAATEAKPAATDTATTEAKPAATDTVASETGASDAGTPAAEESTPAVAEAVTEPVEASEESVSPEAETSPSEPSEAAPETAEGEEKPRIDE